MLCVIIVCFDGVELLFFVVSEVEYVVVEVVVFGELC